MGQNILLREGQSQGEVKGKIKSQKSKCKMTEQRLKFFAF
jgi:hypothetical protein